MFVFMLMVSCSNKNKKEINDLQLEILNDTLISYTYAGQKDTVNVLNYSIQNNSDDRIYFFNQGLGDDSLSRKVYKNGIHISVYETTTNKEVKYSDKLPFEHHYKSNCDSTCNFIQSIGLVKETERLQEDKKLSYYGTKDKRHYFFIHPKEKLFFKQYINLTDSMRYEDARINYAHLKANVKYYSRFFIPSDSSTYREDLPSNVLKSIKANNARVYHGILESKNKVPVKVME